MPIQSLAAAASPTVTPLPNGARLHSVQGECDTKPVYDFIVQLETFATTLQTIQWKYAGTKNGATVMLAKDWPHLSNSSAATPAAAGDVRVTIIAGTGVTLQVYYTSGSLAI